MATQKKVFEDFETVFSQTPRNPESIAQSLVSMCDELKDATGGGGSGSEVSVTQIQSTGTKIATITVDDTPTDLYAPTPIAPEAPFTITASVSAAKDATSVTVTDLSITATSLLTPFCQNNSGSIVPIKTISATTGSATLGFDALDEATSFKLMVINED